jgi:hypothetical protein
LNLSFKEPFNPSNDTQLQQPKMALHRPIKVLYHLHPKLDTMDFTGPFEILSTPVHVSTLSSPSGPTKIFQNTIAAVSEDPITNQNLTLKRHISTSEHMQFLQITTSSLSPVVEVLEFWKARQSHWI